MKTTRPWMFCLSIGAVFPAVVGTAIAADGTDPMADFLSEGKVSLNARARYEGVDQTGLMDANAVTLRTRLGFTTGTFSSLSGSLEFEDIRALDGDAYNQAGLNPGGADRAVVADPEGTELNQAWIAYKSEATSLVLGRQRLVHDNARFIGDVGWRQNMQTFDAFSFRNSSIDGLILNYGYLQQINRVFGQDHPQGTWDSDSHLIHASYAGLPGGTLAGHVYLLDFKNATASSCQTFGLSYAGSQDFDSFKLAYRLEYARQSDYGKSTLNYSTSYYVADVAATISKVTFGGGYEVLGSDGGVGFQTPLATLHAFNGWADMFLATPADGLRDVYGKVSAALPANLALLALYHGFETDSGGNLGNELDVQLAYKFDSRLSGAIKYADFKSDETGRPDVSKLWVQVEFVF